MLLHDPDRRPISGQGPLPDGVEVPEGHGQLIPYARAYFPTGVLVSDR